MSSTPFIAANGKTIIAPESVKRSSFWKLDEGKFTKISSESLWGKEMNPNVYYVTENIFDSYDNSIIGIKCMVREGIKRAKASNKSCLDIVYLIIDVGTPRQKEIAIKLSNLITSKVTSLNHLFNNVDLDIDGISSWDVSNVTSMDETFAYSSFNADISMWTTTKVRKMRSTFENAINFNQHIEKWDMSSVWDRANMLKNARSFNQDIRKWTPPIEYVFYYNDMLDGTGLDENLKRQVLDSLEINNFLLSTITLRKKNAEHKSEYKTNDYYDITNPNLCEFNKIVLIATSLVNSTHWRYEVQKKHANKLVKTLWRLGTSPEYLAMDHTHNTITHLLFLAYQKFNPNAPRNLIENIYEEIIRRDCQIDYETIEELITNPRYNLYLSKGVDMNLEKEYENNDNLALEEYWSKPKEFLNREGVDQSMKPVLVFHGGNKDVSEFTKGVIVYRCHLQKEQIVIRNGASEYEIINGRAMGLPYGMILGPKDFAQKYNIQDYLDEIKFFALVKIRGEDLSNLGIVCNEQINYKIVGVRGQ